MSQTVARAARCRLREPWCLGWGIAILLIPQFGPWLHAHNLHHHRCVSTALIHERLRARRRAPKLSRINRFLIAGSGTLTAALPTGGQRLPRRNPPPPPAGKGQRDNCTAPLEKSILRRRIEQTHSQLRPPSQAPKAAPETKNETGSAKNLDPLANRRPQKKRTLPDTGICSDARNYARTGAAEVPAPTQESAPVV